MISVYIYIIMTLQLVLDFFKSIMHLSIKTHCIFSSASIILVTLKARETNSPVFGLFPRK